MSFKNKRNNVNFSVNLSQHDGSRSFRGEHDDRFYRPPNQRGRGDRGGRGGRNRRGGFKNFNSSHSRFRNNRFGDDDGDESMGGNDHRRGRGGSRGRYSSRGPSRGMRRAGGNRFNDGRGRVSLEKQWYKIYVPFGSRLGEAELFKLIQDNTDIEVPLTNYHTFDQRAYFYVQGNSIAEVLRTLSRRITRPDNTQLVLIVNESGPPKNTTMNDDQKEKLKIAMSERYEASTQLLNLSSFHDDANLKNNSIILQLNRYATMEVVTKIVGEYIPEMIGVDLSSNSLTSLSGVAGLVKVTPGVTSLNLGKNSLQFFDELKKLKGWSSIVELILDGNTMCDSFSTETEYVSAVRKMFPKVVKLDGKDLPPPVSFDIGVMTLPASQGSYFLNDDIKNLLVNFVKEYYTIFDSDNRRSLMAAYNENAQFSYHAVRNATLDRQGDFRRYSSDNRNLKWNTDHSAEKKAKKVKVGLLGVVSALEEFPKTTHDLNSFKVDVMLATPLMLSFVLHGVFKETASKADKPIIRSFSRTFVTTPAGAGVSIVNDMLTVSNAGVEQASNAFKDGAPTPSSSPASSSQTTPTPTADHKQMIENFSKQSGMNPDFSVKCLQENSWDYQRAATNFQELHSQGKIPPEAFVK